MLAGELYIADDPVLAQESLRAQRLVRAFNASDPAEPERRRSLLEELFGSLGEASTVLPPIHCDYGTYVRIGARTFVNAGAVFLDVAPITLGDDVQVGPSVQFLTPTHPLDPELRRARWEAAEPITVGDNAWLGGGVVLLPGVTVGENTVVGAGAVVTRALPPNVLAVGNPARVIRELGPQPG
jgi:maltose O-acetyltransferase